MERYEHAGLVFDVRDSGPTDGEAVVCLHGFPQDATCWDAVTPLLTAQGLRVLAPDQRGYSPGARPGGRRSYRLPELVDDVLGLLDAAGEPAVHLVGHDWGGAVAWALAARHAGRVRSLTVLGTPHPRAMTRALARSTQAGRSSYMAFFQLPRLPEALLLARDGTVLRQLLVRTGLPQAEADHYVRRMREPGAASAALAWYRALPFGAGYRVGTVAVPTSYLWGRRDPSFSPTAVRASRAFVDGRAVGRGLDEGHWLPELAPGATAQAVLAAVAG